jgi:Ras-related protein Rab-8A
MFFRSTASPQSTFCSFSASFSSDQNANDLKGAAKQSMVRVVVYTVNGTAIRTNRELGESLRDLRSYLEREHGFKPEQQKLYRDGTELCGMLSLRKFDQSYMYSYQKGVDSSAQACWAGISQWFWPSKAESYVCCDHKPVHDLELQLLIDSSVLCKPASTHRLREPLIGHVRQHGGNTMFKFVLVGDSATGKSTVLQRYVDGTYRMGSYRTIGIDFKLKKGIDIEGHAVKLQLWDTCGCERFRSMTEAYYGNASGIIVFYDVTSRRTFESVTRWVEAAYGANRSLMLVGNKCDAEERREISFNEGEALALKLGMLFAEMSAEQDIGVNEAFLRFAAYNLDPLLEERQGL